MKLRLLLITIIGIELSSCMWGVPKKSGPEKKDTLAYTYKISKESNLTTSYPLISNDSVLNKIIGDTIKSLYPANKAGGNQFQLAEEKFIGTSTDSQKTLDIKARIIRQDSSIATVIISDSIHNASGSINLLRFINWNTQAKKIISLDDILTNKDKFTAIAEKDFRKKEKLDSTESLKTNYFFKDGKFALNNNFLITPVGIRFLYNVYEIKPLAAGQTELLIPYTQIQFLIKPNSVAAQFKTCRFLNSGEHLLKTQQG